MKRISTLVLGRELHGDLRRNLLSGYLQTALSIGITLVSYPLYLHHLGAERFSIWILVASLINVNGLGTFGLSTALLKLSAECDATREAGRIHQVFAHSAGTVLLLGLVVGLLVATAAPQVLAFIGAPAGQAQLASHWLLWMLLLIPLSYLVDQIQSLVAGLGQYHLANASQILQQAVQVAIAAAMLLAGWWEIALPLAVAVSLALQAAMLVRAARGVLPDFPQLRARFSTRLLRVLFRMGGQAAAATATEAGFHIVNRFLVLRFVGLAAVPVYEIAFNSSMRMRGALVAGFKSLLPDAARMMRQGSSSADEVRRAVKSLTLRVALLSAAICALLGIVGGPLFAIWLGDSMGSGVYDAALPLSFAALANACMVPAYYAAIGLGRFRLLLEVGFLQCAANAFAFYLVWMLLPAVENPVVPAASLALLCAAAWIATVAARMGLLPVPARLANSVAGRALSGYPLFRTED